MATYDIRHLMNEAREKRRQQTLPKRIKRASREDMLQAILMVMCNRSLEAWTVAEICKEVKRRPSTHMRNLMAELIAAGDVDYELDTDDFHTHKRYKYWLSDAALDRLQPGWRESNVLWSQYHSEYRQLRLHGFSTYPAFQNDSE